MAKGDDYYHGWQGIFEEPTPGNRIAFPFGYGSPDYIG